MSEYGEIEQHLRESFADFRLSKTEKHSLYDLLDGLPNQAEMLAYTRNTAFDIFRQQQADNAAEAVKAINWLERVIKTLDSLRSDLTTTKPSADFSPGKSCAGKIIHCLRHAKQSIDICVYTISDNDISAAILAAHKANKNVRVISDNYKAEDDGSDIYYLAREGVAVKLDTSPHHMHHKFAIIDQQILINGSFNWTRSASTKNAENIVTLYDKSLLTEFGAAFESLWEKSTRL